eukprot:225281_1
MNIIVWDVLCVVFFIIGFVIIFFSADGLIDNLRWIADKFHIHPVILGVIILGMDPEECIVSILSAARGLKYVAIGNVIGNSTMANTLCFSLPFLLFSQQFLNQLSEKLKADDRMKIPTFYFVLIIISSIVIALNSIPTINKFEYNLLLLALINLLFFIVYIIKNFIRYSYDKVTDIYIEPSSSSSSSSDSTDSSDDSTNSIDATYIFGDITGLSPGAIYDLHIHTNGDIYNESVVDCNLAGITGNDHFNPDSPLDKHTFGPHMGDLPRIIADEDGNAKFQVVAPEIKLNGVNSVIGRAFIIDLVGPHLQVACGIIEAITDSPDESESSESSDSSADDNAKQRSNAMLKALGNNAFYGETGLLTVEAFITGAIWILVAMFMFCTVFCYCVITRRAKNDTQYMIETIQDSA